MFERANGFAQPEHAVKEEALRAARAAAAAAASAATFAAARAATQAALCAGQPAFWHAGLQKAPCHTGTRGQRARRTSRSSQFAQFRSSAVPQFAFPQFAFAFAVLSSSSLAGKEERHPRARVEYIQ